MLDDEAIGNVLTLVTLVEEARSSHLNYLIVFNSSIAKSSRVSVTVFLTIVFLPRVTV